MASCLPLFPSPRRNLTGLVFLLLCVVTACASCTVAVQRTPFRWPSVSGYMEGVGDMDFAWKERRFSGSFALKLESPGMLFFEVYGPFGQTLLQVRKDGEEVHIMTTEGKIEGGRFFEEQYGMSVDRFMDDLTRKGVIKESEGEDYIDRTTYKVVYTSHRERPRTCWLGPEGSICLTFAELSLKKEGRAVEGNSK